jgi:hypothetical protein
MDDWGTGAIPERPLDPVEVARQHSAAHHPYVDPAATDPRMQQVLQAPQVSYQEAPSPIQRPERRKTRAEILALRRAERNAGVDRELENTGITARVRDLPFTDRIMLRGVPADLRKPIQVAIEQLAAADPDQIGEVLELLDADALLSDVTCIAGFVWPRLARTEEERAKIMRAEGLGEDDVLLVSDLHPDEKAAYRDWVYRDREGSEEDVARIASFPGPGVAQAADRQDSGAAAGGPVPDAADGGERLLA